MIEVGQAGVANSIFLSSHNHQCFGLCQATLQSFLQTTQITLINFETFARAEVTRAIDGALRLGAISFDAV